MGNVVLKVLEEKFSRAFHSNPHPMSIVTLEEGRYLDVNDIYVQTFGFSREELLGRTTVEVGILQDEKARTKLLQLLRERQAVKNLEVEFHTRSGRKVDALLSADKMEIGGQTCLLTVITDVTERKQMEEALRESQELYRAVVELGSRVGEAIVLLQNDERGTGMHVYVNDVWCDITGYSREELLNISMADLIHPRDRDAAVARYVRRLSEENIPDLIELSIIRKDGTEVPVEATYAHSTYKGKSANVGFIRDITERKQAEEALRDSEERYRNLFETMAEGVVLINVAGQIIQANSAAEKLLGLTHSQIEARNYMAPEWDIVYPDRTPMPPEEMAGPKAMKEGRVVLNQVMGIRHSDDSITWMNVSASPLIDDTGKLHGIVGTFADITEQKQAEEREQQLQQELNLARRLATVGQMSSGIAHEINNPLTGVIGFSDLLIKKDLPEDIKKDVNIIYEGAKRIASITDRMLTFARQNKPERTSININDIIETTLAMRAYEMESSNIKVTTELSKDIPLTFADAGQLQQVFLNIILNAEMEMKLAHGKGSLTIKTERVDNTILVSFKDDGPGIPKKNLDKIFDPFFTTRDPDKGTGLGLSICYSIVTQQDGKIYAQSTLGKGATFFVELPVVTKEEQLKTIEPTTEVPKTLSRARILVVDDDTIVQQFLTETLTKEGHEVEVIDNGDDAMERLGSEDYDVILLDVKLPGKNGIEIYQELQKIPKSLTKKVIFITGDVMNADTMVFIESAQTPYITKPLDAEHLLKEIDRIINR